ncbi:uncharacterized protein N7483_001748 [Penicillium malachiteum]|uniref:uncharacterized protein n=1 Tax=Penicillium malachiteum TaxID=1324776 RepID=UPI0025473506|nr:uncharacterized protein N7483_001748 [Penicillium malachiteum]KAJ5736623.1 hypothetical protein N7483_001748 [Penicillium malachiteum]
MGIPSLTKHLFPYGETVVLGDSSSQEDGPPTVRSVVIDGPSLVYHVNYRLLASTRISNGTLDPQPTCDEVSRGFASCLLQLVQRGVQIQRICFDGALPVAKRETRLGRIERSRQRLEISRRQPLVAPSSEQRQRSPMRPAQFWSTRNLPSCFRNLPENPFMVSAVFEDLKRRWTKPQLATELEQEVDSLELGAGEYPWADITVMVAGEADPECARVANLTGAAVLTNDSDLVVHDLGSHGAVVMLNSLHLIEGAVDKDKSEIRGLQLFPKKICERIGIPNIQRFAYELEQDPQLGLSDLIRRAKKSFETEGNNDYDRFLNEYRTRTEEELKSQDRFRNLVLDPRVSELVWQYELPGIYFSDQPHIYLGILHEDPSRRCAWERGRVFRTTAYSLLNLSYPTERQSPSVYEFVRRGRRIVAGEVFLYEPLQSPKALKLIGARLKLASLVLGNPSQHYFWVMFALAEIFQEDHDSPMFPGFTGLKQFLESGRMGEMGDWVDIHFLASIHAVLYSLRILKQVLPMIDEKIWKEHLSLLDELPPAHILLGSRHDLTQGFQGEFFAHQSLCQLFQTYE